MRASQEHMNKIRSHILEAAGTGFREEGYGGLGINGLATRAGMTSGAFYGHFSSKAEAFKEVTKQGLEDYVKALEDFERNYGEDWPEHFLQYYLGTEHVNNLSGSCVVPGLSVDVMRADEKTKNVFTEASGRIAQNVSNGLHKKDSNDAWALIALLAGSVMLARCMSEPAQKQDVLGAAHSWATKIIANEP